MDVRLRSGGFRRLAKFATRSPISASESIVTGMPESQCVCPKFTVIHGDDLSKARLAKARLVPSRCATQLNPQICRSLRMHITEESYCVKNIYSATDSKPARSKTIAFDLDETIGSFADLYSIWTMVGREYQTQQIFDEIMDLYPEFLRVGILSVLEFISSKIEMGECLPIYIYTNNQCEDQSWIERLVNYLRRRISISGKCPLFASPICAFKVKNRRIEPNRTTKEKTYDDFVRCSMLKRPEVCFVDDLYHEKMDHRRVYYIQPPPYFHGLSYKQVVDRYLTSNLWRKIHPDQSPPNINQHIEKISAEVLKKEQEITSKIMYYVREFFFVSSRRHFTRKRQKMWRGGLTKKKR